MKSLTAPATAANIQQAQSGQRGAVNVVMVVMVVVVANRSLILHHQQQRQLQSHMHRQPRLRQ